MRLSTKLGRTERVLVILALTAVLALLAGYLLWGEPGQVSGSLAEVGQGVTPEPDVPFRRE